MTNEQIVKALKNALDASKDFVNPIEYQIDAGILFQRVKAIIDMLEE